MLSSGCVAMHEYSERSAVVLLEHPDEYGNVLTKTSIDTLWELNVLVDKIQACARYDCV